MLLIFFLVTSGNIQAEVVEKVIAVVNGEIILLSELDSIVKPIVVDNKNKFEGEEGKKKLKELKNDILNRMIEEKLIVQEAKEKNIEVSKGEIENALKETKNRFTSESEFEKTLKSQGMTLDRLKERVKENLMAQRLMGSEVKSKVLVDDKEIEEFYKNHKDEFKEPDKIRVSHILVKVKEKDDEEKALKKINEILGKFRLTEVEAGKFAELAMEFSEDESTKEKGGNLGILKKGDMVKEFENAAFSLKEGEFSNIVKTPLGFHIIKLDAKIPGRFYSLTDEIEINKEKTVIRDLIKYELATSKTKSRLDEFLNGLKSKAVIEINL